MGFGFGLEVWGSGSESRFGVLVRSRGLGFWFGVEIWGSRREQRARPAYFQGY